VRRDHARVCDSLLLLADRTLNGNEVFALALESSSFLLVGQSAVDVPPQRFLGLLDRRLCVGLGRSSLQA
jgi:hypothetical protein